MLEATPHANSPGPSMTSVNGVSLVGEWAARQVVGAVGVVTS